MKTNTHILLLAMTMLLFSCRHEDDEIKTYRLAKEAPPVSAPMANNNSMPPLPGMAPAASAKEIEWNVPAGWKEQAPSSMRVGSFLVIGENGQQADVSIIPLSGMAGGDLANVNRWRDQIELPPLNESDLPSNMQTLKRGDQTIHVIDFVSTKPLIEGKFKKRVIAATIPQGERTWFFKITGEDQTVQKSKQKFIDFLSSIRIKQGDPH